MDKSKVTPEDNTKLGLSMPSMELPSLSMDFDMSASVSRNRKKLSKALEDGLKNIPIGDSAEFKNGRYKNLSYDRMMAKVDLDHPRRVVDGKSEKIPLCSKTGNFWLKANDIVQSDMEEIGIGVALYFKLLKFIIGFFIFAAILEIYLFYQYSDGKVGDSSLTYLSLGNLAFNYFQCKSTDYSMSSSTFLSCKSGSLIKQMNEFALQQAGATPEDNLCPAVGDENTPIFLEKLDENCRYSNFEATFKLKIETLFETNCVGKDQCTIDLPKTEWPTECQDKLGDVSKQISSATTEQDYQLALASVYATDQTYIYTTYLCEHPQSEGGLTQEEIAIRIVGIDQTIMFIFLVCITVLSFIVHIDAENHRNKLFETHEFSVILTNLPRITKEFSVEQLKVDLWDHLVKVLMVEEQQIQFFKENSLERACEIVSIQFAMQDQNALSQLKDIQNFAYEIQKIDLKISTVFDDADAKEYQAKYKENRLEERAEFVQKIEAARKNYHKFRLDKEDENGEYNQANAAMVIFRSMEGAKRALVAFEYANYKNYLRKYALPIYEQCVSKKRVENLIFKDKMLKIEPGVEPELLNWENYSVKLPERIIRNIIYGLWVILSLYACFYGIFSLEVVIQDAEAAVPAIVCEDGITAEMANIDFLKAIKRRNGDFNCFCEKIYLEEGTAAMKEFTFPLDQGQYCDEWYLNYWKFRTIPSFVGGIMGCINIFIEITVRLGTAFIKKPLNETEANIGNMRGIAWQQYINLACIYPLIFMNQKLYIIPNPPGVLQGDFEEFSSQWYTKVGAMIVNVMILEIGFIHLFPIFETTVVGLMRLYDRNFSWSDKRQSKKALQIEYEQLYTGTAFDLDYRLAQVIILVWHTFQYSVGLPVLFLIASLNLTIMYWIDKYFVLRVAKTPVNLDEQPIQHAISMMKWCFVFHFLVGFAMITNEGILSSDDRIEPATTSIGEATGITFFDQKRFTSYHAQVFFVLSCILMIAADFSFKSEFLLKFFMKHFANDGEIEKQDSLSDDYYDLLNIKFLVNEYKRTQTYIETLKDMKDKDGSVSKQINLIQRKSALIEEKIHNACKLVTKEANIPSEVEPQIELLEQNLVEYQVTKIKKLKSNVQSYELTDFPDYNGVLKLEQFIISQKANDVIDLDALLVMTTIKTQRDKAAQQEQNKPFMEDINEEDETNQLDGSDKPLMVPVVETEYVE